MGQCVFFGKYDGVSFQNVDVEYEFINRGDTQFPDGFARSLEDEIVGLHCLRLNSDEADYLRNIRFMKRAYVDFLSSYSFDSSEVKVCQSGGDLKVTISGPWYRTIFWEVPLMAIISELYYKIAGVSPKFDYILKTKEKAFTLSNAGCKFSDFGTRRRFSMEVHDDIVDIFRYLAVGTSNVYLAKKYEMTPIGTMAHEMFMAIAALFGYKRANQIVLDLWNEEFNGDLGIALSDTFTSDVFFEQFNMRNSKLFDGVRQDSGDPIQFAQKTINHYQKMRINPISKTIIFSDSLDVNKAIQIADFCKGKIQCAFGIGTHMTNDVGHKPLNMVIKMSKCNGKSTVKLSDTPGKHTGDPNEIVKCEQELGIEE
jgi:nicotinate phosphoribosyltransferase